MPPRKHSEETKARIRAGVLAARARPKEPMPVFEVNIGDRYGPWTVAEIHGRNCYLVECRECDRDKQVNRRQLLQATTEVCGSFGRSRAFNRHFPSQDSYERWKRAEWKRARPRT